MKTKKTSILSFALLLFFILAMKTANACNDSVVSLTSATDNLDGTFTYVIEACPEFNGLEGNPDEWSFTFFPATITINSFTPATVNTTTNDIYTGSASGNVLVYPTSSPIIAHGNNTLCETYTITVTGQATSILVDTHTDDGSPICDHTLTFPACSGAPGFIQN